MSNFFFLKKGGTITISDITSTPGNCSNFKKVCLHLNESSKKYHFGNIPDNFIESKQINGRKQFNCGLHQKTFSNISKLEKHFVKKHMMDLWHIEFPNNDWNHLFPIESEIIHTVHTAQCIAFPTSIRNIKLLKKGCLDFSNKLNDEQINIICKGYKFVYFTKPELIKVKNETVQTCKAMGIQTTNETLREMNYQLGKNLKTCIEKGIDMPDDVVITKADKSGILIAIHSSEYKQIGEDFLVQSHNFLNSPDDGLTNFQKSLEDLRVKWKKTSHWSEKWDNILKIPTKLRSKSIYFLLKIHKPKSNNGLIKGRPIADSVNTYTSILDKGLYKVLAPTRKWIETIIHGSLDVLKTIRNLKNDNNKRFVFVTADISDMYNQIPLSEGIDSVGQLLHETNLINPECIPLFQEAIGLVLKHNTVLFNDKWYTQVKGIAMGANLSPFIANCWLGFLERTAFLLPRPIYGGRYLDDLLGIFRQREMAEEFAENYRQIHPNITLEVSISDDKANFLDILMQNERGNIITSVYFKPSDTLALLHRQSAHPKHTFSGVIESQLLRFVRNNNTLRGFEIASISLFNSLSKRLYQWEEIVRATRKTLHKCIALEEWPFIKQKKGPNLTKPAITRETNNILTFAPGLEGIYNLAKKDERIAFRVHKNLKNRYCHSNFTMWVTKRPCQHCTSTIHYIR